MKRIVIFCALCALWGCKEANTPQTEPIALYYSIAEQSKTDLLTQGDEIGVFASIEGTEHYFAENTKYIVGADGRSLSTAPVVYYPEAKQAINFYAYLPFGGTWDGGVGTFSVPSDQTTTTALKQADLCWAKASSTPVATAVPLQFAHQMARLLITTNTPTEKIAIPNAFSGGILDIKTGVFTNTLRSEVLTTGTELILPAQTVTRLVLTVSGVEYTFEGAIALETAKTTSISLTFNPATKTAMLSGSSTTDWTTAATEGNPTQAVSNVLTMHWPNYVPQGATPDKVVLTINNTDYTVSSGITHSGQSFTVPFASSVLRYPYTITKITFTNLPSCTQLLGATIYKSAASIVGIKDPANAVLIKGLWWATGPLVATGTRGSAGLGGCKIGAPADGGLYFQFGSLIGYKGGAPTNGGSGVGVHSNKSDTWWSGASVFSWENDAMVWPSEMVGTPTKWPSRSTAGISTLKDYYFNYSVTPWETSGQDIRTFAVPIAGDKGVGNLATGRYASKGVGDPCTYYLGDPWRLPTIAEQMSITGKSNTAFIAWTTEGLTGRWVNSTDTFGGVSVPGVWFGPGLNANTGIPDPLVNVFFPASGRRWDPGYFRDLDGCYFGSSNIAAAGSGLYTCPKKVEGLFPLWSTNRSNAMTMRCVRNV